MPFSLFNISALTPSVKHFSYAKTQKIRTSAPPPYDPDCHRQMRFFRYHYVVAAVNVLCSADWQNHLCSTAPVRSSQLHANSSHGTQAGQMPRPFAPSVSLVPRLRPCAPVEKICNSCGICFSRRAQERSSVFSTGTVTSVSVAHRKQGGIFSWISFSMESASCFAMSASAPSRF